jgi:hypothetical protein
LLTEQPEVVVVLQWSEQHLLVVLVVSVQVVVVAALRVTWGVTQALVVLVEMDTAVFILGKGLT